MSFVGLRARRGGVAAGVMCLVCASATAFEGCGLDVDGAQPVDLDAGASGDARFDGPQIGDGSHDGTSPPDDASLDAREDADAASNPDGSPDACEDAETNCLDGIDNDCNGLADCADPACTAGYRCVAAAPPTWSGFALYADARTTACPSSFPNATDTYESLTFAAASCAACACTASGVTCAGASTLDCGVGATCTSLPTSTTSAWPTCTDLAMSLSLLPTDSCNLSAPAASGGACALASGGTPQNAEPSFAKLSRVCTGAHQGTGCSGNQVCVAKTPSASHGVCILQSIPNGAATPACPASYPSAHAVAPSAKSYDDARGCTACHCAASPTGGTCSAKATLHTGAGCTDPDGGGPGGGGPGPSDNGAITIASSADCKPNLVAGPSKFASVIETLEVSSQGTCGSTGGGPQGTVTPKDQTMYCCED